MSKTIQRVFYDVIIDSEVCGNETITVVLNTDAPYIFRIPFPRRQDLANTFEPLANAISDFDWQHHRGQYRAAGTLTGLRIWSPDNHPVDVTASSPQLALHVEESGHVNDE